MGTSPKGSSYNKRGEGLPLLNGPTEFGEYHPLCTVYTTESIRECEKNDLIFCVRGSTTGRMNWADKRYSLGRGVCAIRGETYADTRFIKYALDYRLNALLNLAGGGTFPNLTRDTIHKFEIDYPESRRTVAAILGRYDDLLERNTRRIQLLEEMARLIYDEWFVRFKFPDGNRKGKTTDSGLGAIPEGWEVKTFGDLGAFKNGINYSRGEVGDAEFRIVNVRDIANSRILLETSLDKIRIRSSKAKEYLLRKEDILVARSASPGEVSLVVGDHEDAIYSGFSIRLRPNNPDNQLYLFMVLEGLGRQLENFSTGTALKSVNQETLKNTKVLIPPKTVLTEFRENIEPIFELVCNLKLSNRNLMMTRDTLLPKLVSGGVDVSRLDIKGLGVEA